MPTSIQGNKSLGTGPAVQRTVPGGVPTIGGAATVYRAPGAVAAANGGKVAGPYDKFRAQRPNDIPEEWWNQYIDSQNAEINQIKQSDPNWDEARFQAQLSRITPDALANAVRQTDFGQYKSTIAGSSPVAPSQSFQQVASDQLKDTTINRILSGAEQNQKENRDFFDQRVVPLLNGQQTAAQGASALDLQALAQQTQARDKLQSSLQQALQQQATNAFRYNEQGAALYNNYANQQNALNAQDSANLSRYMSETDPLMQRLTARDSNAADVAAQQAALQRAVGIADGSLDYQAALAHSDAGDVSRQRGAFNDLQGAGRGSLDYAAAQYASNSEDVGRQEAIFRRMTGVADGNLDYTSKAASAYASPQDIANQRQALTDIQNDVKYGDAEQKAALDLIKSRTGVKPTGEEDFLYELNRRMRETQDKSSRDAVSENLAARGIRSGGAQIAMQQAQAQQSSQDQLLRDLGANANAIQRAQAYTNMQANQTNAMRGSAQNALGLQSNLTSTMRDQSFGEEYKRGLAADQASANNQNIRFAGTQGAGSMATAMRNASDTVGMFNTGQQNNAYANNQQTRLGGMQGAASVATAMRNASDNMAIQNAGFQNTAYANNQATRMQGANLQANQSNAIRTANDAMIRFQDQFAQSESERLGTLATNRANTNLTTTAQQGQRNTTTYNSGVDLNDTNYGRDRQTIEDQRANAPLIYGADTDVARGTADVGQRNYERATGLVNTASNVGTGRAGISAADSGITNNALLMALGLNDYKAATGVYR